MVRPEDMTKEEIKEMYKTLDRLATAFESIAKDIKKFVRSFKPSF